MDNETTLKLVQAISNLAESAELLRVEIDKTKPRLFNLENKDAIE